MGDGKPLALRTFHIHREAVAEIFGVEIKCDLSTYEYYVSSPNLLKSDSTRQWLLNSFTLSNMITAGHNMRDRILFEDIPGGTEFIQSVIEAMQQNKVLHVGYQPFGKQPVNYHIQPYAMKVYNQRWYIVGYINESGEIRNISLDRILSMSLTSEVFVLPDNFDAEEYYSNTIGIFVNDKLAPQKMLIRAFGVHVEYMRSLPLHHTQHEIKYKHNDYSDFEYTLCITPELITRILSMGDKVEVIEPVELKEKVKARLQKALERYT